MAAVVRVLTKLTDYSTHIENNIVIWLESARKYIPISRMSPNHVQSRGSLGLIFSKKYTNSLAFMQQKIACL